MKKIYLLLLGMVAFIGANAQVINSYPYMEDFESFAACGTGCGAACTLTGATAWANDTGDNLDWLIDVGGTSSSSTGPSIDHNPGTASGNYLYVETSCSGTGYPSATANLLSPQLDLVGANQMQFEFWWHAYGATQGMASVDVSNDFGVTWNLDVIPTWTDNQDLWQMSSVDLGAWSNDTVIVRIRYVSGTSFTGDIAVDDIRVYDLLPDDAGVAMIDSPSVPSCALGNDVWITVQNYGTDTMFSVDVDWTVNAVAQTGLSWAGALPPVSDTMIMIGSYAFVQGDVLKTWTSLPNGVIEFGSGAGNDTTSMTVQDGLSGIYAIGGATPDYLSFSDAVNALNIFGICGPVVFNVNDSLYNEQIVLTEITNSSLVNTVTFQSASGMSSNSGMWYAGTGTGDNFIVQFDGADNIIFKNLSLNNRGTTFGTALLFSGDANDNTVDSCWILGDSLISTTSTNMALVYSPSGASSDSNNVFSNNTFEFGSYSMYWYGNSTADLEAGTVVSNNNFSNFYYRGLHLYNQDYPQVSSNVLTPGPNYTGAIYRIYVVYGDNDMSIDNNHIHGESYGYGIYMSNCDALVANRGEIFNNFIHVGDTASTNTSYGIYLTACGNQSIANNSINMTSQGTTSRAMYVTGGTSSHIYNNVLANNGPGYGLYLLSGVSEEDNNAVFTPNGIPYYFGGDIADVATWNATTGMGISDLMTDPLFISADDLHTCSDTLDMAGIPMSFVTTDIDGNVRASVPDIGADEYFGMANFDLGPETVICSSATLNIGPNDSGLSYVWSTGDTISPLAVTAGIYTLQVIGACGTATDSITITNYPNAVAGFTSSTSFLTAILTNTSSDYDSVAWDFGDGIGSSSLNDPIYVYGSNGMYNITLIVYNQCGSDTIVQPFQVNVGLSENVFENGMEVYPNPSQGDFTITGVITELEFVSIEVLNVLGQVVYTEALGKLTGEFTHQVKMGQENKGVFFLRVTAGESTAVHKISIR
ncbi:MAG: hypothetical protein ACI9J3_000915 [Parvicellaceae bacterium]|jgi:hypothetical protein